MLRNCFITLLLFTGILSSYGQSSLWKDHFSYRNCRHAAESDNYVAVGSNSGLMMYNKRRDEIKTLSRVNGLSDTGISAVQSLADDRFIIGYTNGNIDIIASGEVINIPDLKNKQIKADKQINHFYVNGRLAYCSTGFGLLIINTEKYEVADAYYLGVNSANLTVYQSYIRDDTIYAATERGLLKTLLSNPQITYYEAWEEISGSSNPVVAVNYFNNALIAVKKEANNLSVIYGHQYHWTELKKLSDFESLSASDMHLLITQAHVTERYQEDFVLAETIDHYRFDKVNTADIQPGDALYSDSEKTYFIADKEYGLVKKTMADDLTYVADGPYSNIATSLHATHHGVFAVSGSAGQNKPAEYSYFINGEWSFFKASDTGNGSQWVDLTSVCSSKTDDSEVYFSSRGAGLFKHNADSPICYGITDKGLQESEGKVNVGGLASDSKGNIWMTNGGVESGIVLKSGDEWHRFNYASSKYMNGSSQMLISKADVVWMTILNSGRQELLVISPEGTPTDDTDDKYRGPIGQSSEAGEERNKGQLKLWDADREVITNTVLCMAEDKNEYIWLGTDRGVLVYYRPRTVFSEQYPVASRIKVPRNDGSKLADYLLEKEKVSCIAVDGANRKWLGTEESGVYLVSDDGLKTHHTFNTDNSPLPSNHITAIAVSPLSGEVFIATSKGIVSYKGKATEGAKTFSKVYAYPNPVRNDFSGDITITGLMQDSKVKITTTAGRLVHETRSLGGKAYWNGTNFNGEKVKTGVYLVYVSAEEGQQSAVTKILIVR